MHLFCVDCILQNGWVRLDRTLLCFAGGRVHAIFLFNLLCLVYFVLLFLHQLPAYISIEFGAWCMHRRLVGAICIAVSQPYRGCM